MMRRVEAVMAAVSIVPVIGMIPGCGEMGEPAEGMPALEAIDGEAGVRDACGLADDVGVTQSYLGETHTACNDGARSYGLGDVRGLEPPLFGVRQATDRLHTSSHAWALGLHTGFA